MRHEVAILLHNVRSAHNVGSIFRTADAAGAARIFISGYTPKPIDRFGRVQKEISKTALGAQSLIEWKQYHSPVSLIKRMKKQGWMVVGVEQDKRSIDYSRFKLRKPTIFLFGNEVRGLSKPLRALCDTLIEIPMRGGKESLNVSVAAGIILFSCIS